MASENQTQAPSDDLEAILEQTQPAALRLLDLPALNAIQSDLRKMKERARDEPSRKTLAQAVQRAGAEKRRRQGSGEDATDQTETSAQPAEPEPVQAESVQDGPVMSEAVPSGDATPAPEARPEARPEPRKDKAERQRLKEAGKADRQQVKDAEKAERKAARLAAKTAEKAAAKAERKAARSGTGAPKGGQGKAGQGKTGTGKGAKDGQGHGGKGKNGTDTETV